jgi:hypothetical protein
MHSGSCLCGSVQYRIESDLKAIVNCHCKFCSKAHGAPFTPMLFASYADLEVVAGAELVARYRVERLGADRCFCTKCGTRLFNHSIARGRISLMVTTLDAPGTLRPVAHISTESKCAWFEIEDDLPQFQGIPTPDDFKRLFAA